MFDTESLSLCLSGKTEEEYYAEKYSGHTDGLISIWRDPYEEGYSTTRARQVTFMPGLTVLTGCNGSGKTTLLHNIKAECKKKKVPCVLFDNLHDGGSCSVSNMFYNEDYNSAVHLLYSSEGESIGINTVRTLSKLVGDCKKKFVVANEIWLLLDAVDSGLSVDGVAEIRNVLNLMINDITSMGKTVYVVASANEYELAKDAECIDVISGKTTHFSSYTAYRNFILKSREKKDARIKKAAEKRQKKEEEKKK